MIKCVSMRVRIFRLKVHKVYINDYKRLQSVTINISKLALSGNPIRLLVAYFGNLINIVSLIFAHNVKNH